VSRFDSRKEAVPTEAGLFAVVSAVPLSRPASGIVLSWGTDDKHV
jgi:hypothetical protein